jgi:cytochrome c553
MKPTTFAGFVFFAGASLLSAQTVTGDIAAGKALWEPSGNTGALVYCQNCHGQQGKGGFGPDLAGHNLTAKQFIRAVRSPWGIMPAFTAKTASDQDLINIAAYLASLPKAPDPAPFKIPANATPRQALHMAIGCSQCHGAVLATPRKFAGAEGADFEWFKRYVYNHSQAITGQPMVAPRIRMGDYSKERLPEFYLRELWQYFSVEAGLRVPVEAEIWTGSPSGNGVEYKVIVGNTGEKGKGLAAEDLTVTVPLPAGAKVAANTGAGYQGVRHDDKANADVAVWKLARLVAGEQQTLTLTLSGGSGSEITKGNIGWAKPAFGDGNTDSSPIRKGAADGILRMRDVAGNAYTYTAP